MQDHPFWLEMRVENARGLFVRSQQRLPALRQRKLHDDRRAESSEARANSHTFSRRRCRFCNQQVPTALPLISNAHGLPRVLWVARAFCTVVGKATRLWRPSLRFSAFERIRHQQAQLQIDWHQLFLSRCLPFV